MTYIIFVFKISENVLGQLSNVPYEETKFLLKKFFQKIIDLKELEHKRSGEIGELQVPYIINKRENFATIRSYFIYLFIFISK